jgi:hypothetical protein
LPFVEHIGLPRSLHVLVGSALPAAMGVHLPLLLGSVQLRQAPPQAVSQQTRSTQWPLSQSSLTAQVLPSLILPHEPFLQTCPGSHCASLVQPTVHLPSAHRLGPQVVTPGGLHVPRPSHTPAVLSRTAPAHEGATHRVSAAYFSHAPKPSHLPVVPQLSGPMSRHMPRTSGLPESMGMHVPVAPAIAHETQAPSQAPLQHTPSAQNVERHWAPLVHARPFISLPQLWFSQRRPAEHSMLLSQRSRQAPFESSQA